MTYRSVIAGTCFLILLTAAPSASAQTRPCSTGAVGCKAHVRLAQAEFFAPVEDPNKARELREGLGPQAHPTVPENGPAGPGGDGLEACLMKAGRRSDVAPMLWRGNIARRPNGWASLLGISRAYAIGTAPGLVAGYAVGLLDPACVLRRGATQWRQLVQGEPVEVGDTVATGATGRLRLQFTDRDEKRNSGPSILNLAPLSELVIEKFEISYDDPPAATGLWDLIRGKMRVFLKAWSPSSTVNVRAGVAVCGIRGTDFILAHDPSHQQVDLQVHEGKVEFSTPKASRMVQTGQSITASGDTMGNASRLYQDAWEQDVAAIDQGLPQASPAPAPSADGGGMPGNATASEPDPEAFIQGLSPDNPLYELFKNLPRRPDQKDARTTPVPKDLSPNAESKAGRGWLGAHIQNIDADMALALGLTKAEGAIVSEVLSGGPAVEKLKPGDAILEVGGESVHDAADVARRIAGHAPGEAIMLKFLRNGTPLYAAVVLGTWPESH